MIIETRPWKVILTHKISKEKKSYYGFDCEYLAFDEQVYDFEIINKNPKYDNAISKV